MPGRLLRLGVRCDGLQRGPAAPASFARRRVGPCARPLPFAEHRAAEGHRHLLHVFIWLCGCDASRSRSEMRT
eukprot:9920974-Lingulodinium_polyedra.AAC.1